jgi:uncharacterized RDD family membrane protein YckC
MSDRHESSAIADLTLLAFARESTLCARRSQMVEMVLIVLAILALLPVAAYLVGFMAGLFSVVARILKGWLHAGRTSRDIRRSSHSLKYTLWTLVAGVINVVVLMGGAALAIASSRSRELSSVKIIFSLFGLFILARVLRKRTREGIATCGYATDSAEAIVESCRREGRPFAVFLRGFEAERRSIKNAIPFAFGMGGVSTTVWGRPTEGFAVRSLGGVPLVALPDPRDPVPMPGAHRFEKVPADWEAFVKPILIDAKYIIVYIEAFSKGIEAELRMLSGLDLGAKSLLVISNKLATMKSPEGDKIASELKQAGRLFFEKVDRRRNGSRGEVDSFNRFQEAFHSRFGPTAVSSQAPAAVIDGIVPFPPARLRDRMFACLLDFTAVAYLVGFPLVITSELVGWSPGEAERLFGAASLIAFPPYLAIIEGVAGNAGIGKRMSKLRVVSVDNLPISLPRSFARVALFISLTLALYPISLAWAIVLRFYLRRAPRLFHDLLTGTKVVSTAMSIAEAGLAKQQPIATQARHATG